MPQSFPSHLTKAMNITVKTQKVGIPLRIKDSIPALKAASKDTFPTIDRKNADKK